MGISRQCAAPGSTELIQAEPDGNTHRIEPGRPPLTAIAHGRPNRHVILRDHMPVIVLGELLLQWIGNRCETALLDKGRPAPDGCGFGSNDAKEQPDQ